MSIAFRRDDREQGRYYLVEVEDDGRAQPELGERIFLNAVQAHRLNASIVHVLTQDDVRNAAAEEAGQTS